MQNKNDDILANNKNINLGKNVLSVYTQGHLNIFNSTITAKPNVMFMGKIAYNNLFNKAVNTQEASLLVDKSKKHKIPKITKDKLLSKGIIIAIVLLIGLVCIIVGYIIFFSNHILFNTSIAGQDVSLWSRAKITNFVNDKADQYTISIKNGTDEVKVDNVILGLKILPEDTVNDIFISQNTNALDRIMFWKNRSYKFKYIIDQAKLEEFLATNSSIIKKQGQNAKISIENGSVIILPEIIQEEESFNQPKEKIMGSLDDATSLVLERQAKSTIPKITSKSLEPLSENIQSLINTDIKLNLNGRIIATTKDQRASWITIAEDTADQSAIKFDEIKINAYIDGAVRPYIKSPKSRVVINADDGTQRELVSGQDGLTITDKESVVSSIVKALNVKKPSTIDVMVAMGARPTVVANQYPKWIQVDLTNKRLYAYENDKLVKEILISAGAPATPTVLGEYNVKYKVRKQTMRGLNSDGSRYTQPNVEWILFFYGDYSIHGNYWRPDSWFGNINSSHGCVGMKNIDAEWVYNWSQVGTPIIIHY